MDCPVWDIHNTDRVGVLGMVVCRGALCARWMLTRAVGFPRWITMTRIF